MRQSTLFPGIYTERMMTKAQVHAKVFDIVSAEAHEPASSFADDTTLDEFFDGDSIGGLLLPLNLNFTGKDLKPGDISGSTTMAELVAKIWANLPAAAKGRGQK